MSLSILRQRFKIPEVKYDCLASSELFWRDLQPWLRNRGYELRARYQPGWIPSWTLNGKCPTDCEDSIALHYGMLIDATRSDGEAVMLKRIIRSKDDREIDILRFFSEEPRSFDPRNHCVPLYELLELPDEEDSIIAVMPFLRRVDDPEFVTFGEVVQFLHVIFEGLHYMHAHNVAHRDITYLNVMMSSEPLYPESYHPVEQYMTRDLTTFSTHYTRTERPVKYYLIDFGLSRVYDRAIGPPLDYSTRAGDRTVPEYQDPTQPHDPFAIDVYCIGNIVRNLFSEGNATDKPLSGFEFIEPLVESMTQTDPTKRPLMKDVVVSFEAITSALSTWKLRSRLAVKNEPQPIALFRSIRHWLWQLTLIVRRIPPVPQP